MAHKHIRHAVIFDMDGVIADSEHITYKGLRDFLKKIDPSKDYSEKEFYGNLGKSYKEYWTDLEKVYNVKKEKVIKRFRRLQYKIIRKELQEIEGATELLKALKKCGVKTALATSSLGMKAYVCMEKLGLEKYFHALVTGNHVKRLKPAPDVFLYAAKRLKEKPENCIVVEDTVTGIRAAKAAGMIPVLYHNKHLTHQKGQHHLKGVKRIYSLKEFVKLAEGLQ